MAATTYGTVHLYGIAGTVANATVLSFKRTKKCANAEKQEDENGNVIERRYDDVTHDADISIRIRASYTIPDPGTTLVYNGETFEVTEVGETQVNKGFRTVDLKLTKSAGITYS